ncbi:MAG: type 4a pilus biogenesis protein PilO [Candidatus Rokubacteria bacterium]|nr:type 4a pilus biogenesis protein PilO [Candidatus Rokubacteria bacterium]
MDLAATFAPITNQPRSTKLALGAVLILAVLGGGYFLLISPAQSEVAALRAKNDSLQAEVTQNRAVAANLSRFRQEAIVLRRRLDAVRERLPNEKEIPPLYRTVSNLAFQSGLAFSIFQPREPQQKDFYAEVPITVSAEVGYHQLGNFFERLTRLPRIVNVDELKLTGINKPTGSVRADMTLKTYMFKTEPGAGGGKR